MRMRCRSCGLEIDIETHRGAAPMACQRCSGSLTSMTGRRGAMTAEERSAPAGALSHSPGDVVRHYRLEKNLGRGAFAEVWRAEDMSLRRSVAIKVLARVLPEEVEHFYHEARSIAALDHENITPIYEVFEAEGRHYLVMKYLEGKTLDDAELSVSAALEAIYLVSRAIEYAHRRGIVHRDIKPSNIIIDRGSDRLDHRVFVCDFGIALTADAGEEHRKGIFGTPNFMSPEQAWGEVATPLSDVYSLGATLYAVLTGEPPFTGGTIEEKLWNVRSTEPPKLRGSRPDLHPALEKLVALALSKDPKARPSSANEFGEELRGLLNTGRIYQTILPGAPKEVVDVAAELKRGFGKYIVVSTLGQNPIGPVFKAWDTSLQCFVAVRVMDDPVHPEARRAVDLAMREARLCATLRHPAIPQIYEIGQFKGRHYQSRSYVEGENLSRMKISLAATLQALRRAAEAAHYAHGEGIVHGHIVPENILVGEGGRIFLIGFGLGPSLSAHPHSLAYRPPEAVVSPQVDVFGLGMTLYEILAEPPRERRELQRMAGEGNLPPLKPSLPADLRDLIDQAVAPSLARRFETAFQLQQALDKVLAGMTKA